MSSPRPAPAAPTARTSSEVRLGLRQNAVQFTLLVVVNAFVGAMVGLERSILPSIAEQDLHLAARAAILSFIVVFGVTKALIGDYRKHNGGEKPPAADVKGEWYSLDQTFVMEPGKARLPKPPID